MEINGYNQYKLLLKSKDKMRRVNFEMLKSKGPKYTLIFQFNSCSLMIFFECLILNNFIVFFILYDFYMLSQMLQDKINFCVIFKETKYTSKHFKGFCLLQTL